MRFVLAQPSANARLDASRIPEAEPDSPDAAPEDAAAPPAVERITSYHPWKYMYPHTWTLSYLSDPLGLGGSGRLQTSFGDPVGDHAVGVDVTIPRDGDASVRLDYIWSGLWPQLALSVTRTALIAGDLIMDGRNVGYRQHVETGSASVARRAVWLLALFPASLFFSAVYTEALFLLLSVGSFYAARRGTSGRCSRSERRSARMRRPR